MKKCISCNKEIEDLYHQCPHCGGETFIQSGSAEDSSSWYDSMAKQSEASKLVDKSVKLIMVGKFAEAERILKKAIDINPYNATAHGNMGGVFHRQGRLEEAIPWFEKALKLNQNLEGVPEALKEVRAQVNKSKRGKKNKEQKTIKDASSKIKCPSCGYIMDEPDWRCPKCYHEFDEENIDEESPSKKLASNDTTPQEDKKVTNWGSAAATGAFGGAIAGIIASHGSGKLGFAGFIVFFLTMMGVNGGTRKAFAGLVFAAVAALVFVIFKQ